MPPRRINLIILAFWVYAAWELFAQDILPDLIVGPPPDMRTLTRVETRTETRWSILIEEDSDGPDHTPKERAVGQVRTLTVPQADGGVRLSSKAWIDTGEALRRTPFESVDNSRLEILAGCWVDQRGNLANFHVSLYESRMPSVNLMAIDGRLRGNEIRISTGGLIPYIGPRVFHYQPHSLVQTSFSPLDRLPGLHVGQRWEQRVVNPLTSKVMKCRSEVVGRETIMYDGNPVSTLVVLTKSGGITPSARTWVRPDGLVLRQEVPLMIRNLILQRLPYEPPSRAPQTLADEPENPSVPPLPFSPPTRIQDRRNRGESP